MSNQPAKLKKKATFSSFCKFDSWCDNTIEDKDKYFVGLKIDENGKPKIFFPMGYRVKAVKTEEEDIELKRDCRILLSLLADKSLPNYFTKEDYKKSNLNFPIYAFLGVLQYYQDYGYFEEREPVYKKGFSGKISWSKTIKSINPQVFKSKNAAPQIAYLDLITRKISIKENNLITDIHKFCVYKALKIIGPIFNFNENAAEPPQLTINYPLFSSTLLGKINSSYNDRHLELFQNLLTVVKFFANEITEGNVRSKTLIGVNTFAPVWQMMIDRIFGTVSLDEKKKFYPNLKAQINGHEKTIYLKDDDEIDGKKRSTLFPDTIMLSNKSTFILDAKYYKFGMMAFGKKAERKRCARYLPGAESVCKQMAYAEHVEHQIVSAKELFFKGLSSKRIFNAFIMPYCSDCVPSNCKLNPYFKMQNKGSIYGSWKNILDKNRPYHSIACILLDMKNVMRNYTPSKAAQKELAKIIKDCQKITQ